ncbi:MAG TPA: hypothetical protein VGR84_18815 [Candidatus Acidoferrales bacterium]|nr:hypothetical protein [Candidatus Acidoferrales bacterium]
MSPAGLRSIGQLAVAALSMLIFLVIVIEAYRRADATSISTILGFAGGFASATVQYYLGSSVGSQAKDEKLNATAPPAG